MSWFAGGGVIWYSAAVVVYSFSQASGGRTGFDSIAACYISVQYYWLELFTQCHVPAWPVTVWISHLWIILSICVTLFVKSQMLTQITHIIEYYPSGHIIWLWWYWSESNKITWPCIITPGTGHTDYTGVATVNQLATTGLLCCDTILPFPHPTWC